MEDAARISYADLIEWMVDDYGFKKNGCLSALITSWRTICRQHGRYCIFPMCIHRQNI